MAMIHHEHERYATTRKHAELAAALTEPDEAKMPKGHNREMHQFVTDGLCIQLDILQAELDAYATLNVGDART
jgi:hypothetical protein